MLKSKMFRTPLWLAAAPAMIGCSESSVDTSMRGPELPVVLEIQTETRLFSSTSPAAFDVVITDTPYIMIEVFGHTPEWEGWSASVPIAWDTALSGEYSVPVKPALGYAQAGITNSERTDSTTATEGQFSASIANGRITGRLDVSPAILSATFEGDVAVRCHVPASTLGIPKDQLPETENSSDLGPLVEVEDLSTEECRPFASLR